MEFLPTESDTLLIGAALFVAALTGIVVSLITDFLMTYYTASDEETTHANSISNDRDDARSGNTGTSTRRRRNAR